MAVLKKRLAGPARLTGTAATLYTTPGSTQTCIRRIRISNPAGSGGAFTFTLSIGTDGVTTRIYEAVSVAEGDSKDIFGPFNLAATEIVQGLASTTNKLVYQIDGEETT